MSGSIRRYGAEIRGAVSSDDTGGSLRPAITSACNSSPKISISPATRLALAMVRFSDAVADDKKLPNNSPLVAQPSTIPLNRGIGLLQDQHWCDSVESGCSVLSVVLVVLFWRRGLMKRASHRWHSARDGTTTRHSVTRSGGGGHGVRGTARGTIATHKATSATPGGATPTRSVLMNVTFLPQVSSIAAATSAMTGTARRVAFTSSRRTPSACRNTSGGGEEVQVQPSGSDDERSRFTSATPPSVADKTVSSPSTAATGALESPATLFPVNIRKTLPIQTRL